MRSLMGVSLAILLSVAASDATARSTRAQHQYASISREDVCKTIAASAQAHGLPVAFFGNLIYQESGLKPHVVSHVGARGIAQFMPSTARLVGLKNPFNPREALPASAKFLRSLLHQFGNNYGLAAAAYNAGPGRIQRWLKRRTVLPKETRDYVMTITGERAEHWRAIRGNRFTHKLAKRMPCRTMPQFIHNVDDVVALRRIVRKALVMMPRTIPAATVQSAAFVQPAAATTARTETANLVIASADPAAPLPLTADIQPPANAPAAVEQPARVEATGAVNSTGSARAAAPRTAPVSSASQRPATPPKRMAKDFIPPLPRANPARPKKLAAGGAGRQTASAARPIREARSVARPH